jgi:hypothetical protein
MMRFTAFTASYEIFSGMFGQRAAQAREQEGERSGGLNKVSSLRAPPPESHRILLRDMDLARNPSDVLQQL